MSIIDRLLRLARCYADAEGVSLTTVSWRVLGDSKKLRALERGADIQSRRAEAAFVWFSDNWPDDLPWPSDVPRPSRSSRAPDLGAPAGAEPVSVPALSGEPA